MYHKNYEPLARELVRKAQYVLGHGVELLFVFDGVCTPVKRCTDQERQRRRAHALATVMHVRRGHPVSGGHRAAISLVWPGAKATVSLLRENNIPYLIAPCEADAQLVLLAQSGVVWAVAIVDADFIIHGIPRVFFRVSWANGRAALWDRAVAHDYRSDQTRTDVGCPTS